MSHLQKLVDFCHLIRHAKPCELSGDLKLDDILMVREVKKKSLTFLIGLFSTL